MRAYVHLWQCLTKFFVQWEMFQTNPVQKIQTHFLRSVRFFFLKSCRLWDNLVKYGRAAQVTDNIVRRMHIAFLVNRGYRHMLGICNTYGFSTVTVVTRTRLNVTCIRLPVLYYVVHTEVVQSSTTYLSPPPHFLRPAIHLFVFTAHVPVFLTFKLPCVVRDTFLNNQPNALIIQIYSVI